MSNLTYFLTSFGIIFYKSKKNSEDFDQSDSWNPTHPEISGGCIHLLNFGNNFGRFVFVFEKNHFSKQPEGPR